MKKFLPLLVLVALGGAVKLDEATYSIGQKYYQQSLYTEAEKRFLEIVRKFPDSQKFRESLFMLGKTYAQLGNDKAALQYYKLLLNKAQSTGEKQGALLGISKSWLQLGVYDKAAEFYSFFAAEYPASEYAPAALYYAGLAREREGKMPEAVEKYRRVFELYPSSDFQARAIEKVAVLDQNTPETLWNTPTRTAKKPQGLFPDEDSAPVPGYAAPPARAQEYPLGQGYPQAYPPQQNYPWQAEALQPVPAQPLVITQMIQSPPLVITQTAAPIILTQTVASPPVIVTQTIITPMAAPNPPAEASAPALRPLPRDIQTMISNKVVVFSNGNLVSGEDVDPVEAAKVAQYRRQWEAEQLQKDSEQKLQTAARSVDRMLNLSDDKERALQAKEAALIEKQNALRQGLSRSLGGASLVSPKPYEGAPKPALTNTAPAAAPAAPPAPAAPEPLPADNLYPGETDAAYDEEGAYAEDYALDADIDNYAEADDYPLLDQ